MRCDSRNELFALRSFADRTLAIFREVRSLSSDDVDQLSSLLDKFQVMASNLVHGNPKAGEDAAEVVGLIARLMQETVKARKTAGGNIIIIIINLFLFF